MLLYSYCIRHVVGQARVTSVFLVCHEIYILCDQRGTVAEAALKRNAAPTTCSLILHHHQNRMYIATQQVNKFSDCVCLACAIC